MPELRRELAGEDLQWHGRDEGLEQRRDLGQPDQVIGVRHHVLVPVLGEHDRASPPGTHFLDAADGLFLQLVATLGGYDDEHRQALFDDRDGTVLELACGEALGVDVGELLELERALERNGIADVAAEEQDRSRPGELGGELTDLVTLIEHPLDAGRDLLDLGKDRGDLVAVLRALDLSDVEGQ